MSDDSDSDSNNSDKDQNNFQDKAHRVSVKQQMKQDIEDLEEMYDYQPDLFSQDMFLFLFDEEMNFQKKNPESLEFKPQDYQKMRRINRNALEKFLKGLKEEADNNQVKDHELI